MAAAPALLYKTFRIFKMKKTGNNQQAHQDMAKKVILSISERLVFGSLLPQNGKMIEMEIVKNLTRKVSFAPEEIEEFQLKDMPNGSVMWNKTTAKEREFSFEESEIKVIQKGIAMADEKEAITSFNLDLAKKFQNIKTQG
jgi:hypothetical protein